MNNECIAQERAAFEAAFRACGYAVPVDTTPDALRTAVAIPFMPTEAPLRARDILGLGERAVWLFSESIHLALVKGIMAKDEATLALGHATGRYFAAAIDAGQKRIDPPLEMSQDQLTVDGQHIEVAFENKRIVEFGMGVNGLMSHLNNLREDRYAVTAITRNPGEAVLLDGMAAFFGVASKVTNNADGIASCLDGMLKTGSPYKSGVDVVVASRVQTKDKTFTDGVKRSSDLLCAGGLVVARGPLQDGPRNIGYHRVAKALRQNWSLRVETEHTRTEATAGVASMVSKLVVARAK